MLDGRQPDRSAVLATEACAGNPAGAELGRGAVDRAAMAAICACHLDRETVARKVAEGQQRSAYGHAPSNGVNDALALPVTGAPVPLALSIARISTAFRGKAG